MTKNFTTITTINKKNYFKCLKMMKSYINRSFCITNKLNKQKTKKKSNEKKATKKNPQKKNHK